MKNLQDKQLTIRSAESDLNEGLAFAHFFDEAADGFLKSMLGDMAFDIIAEAYVKENNEYSFENVSIAEYKGQIIGMVSGYTYDDKKAFSKNIVVQSSKGSKFRINMFLLVGKFLSRVLGPRKKGDYYLQAIAVDSEMRGKGIGQLLLKHSEELAVAKGSEILSLDVSSKNVKAIKSYHNFGMLKYSHWPNFLKLPPVFTRLEKNL